ncbi:MAG TPA: hypothetical protein VFC68_06905 [Treponemataceae bacterium]|nr:hypothetical protein [Treponemataceae bacterium]
MKRIFLFLCTALLLCTPFFAQDIDGPDTTTQGIDDTYVYKINQIGDQFIELGITIDVPIRPSASQLKTGGAGTIGYQRFIADSLAIGGNVSFAYSKTIGRNIFYFVPMMAKISYQFSTGKFEFPISLNIGGSFENYIGRSYFGLTIKPEIGAYWRYSSDWSFGLHSGVYIMPQWYKDSSDNYTGIITDIGLSVRYHF